jgi:hypothetical protein
MTDVIGDTSELSSSRIVATATHSLSGSSGSFNFLLSSSPGIRKYFASHARVLITGSVRVSISGEVTSTTSTSATIAACPDKYSDWPSTQEQVLQLQGAVRVQHSLLVVPQEVSLAFGNETTEQLKPSTLVDYAPRIVGHFTVAGGSPSSRCIVSVVVPLTVTGVAHHKTW